jgi:hypothetical protein
MDQWWIIKLDPETRSVKLDFPIVWWITTVGFWTLRTRLSNYLVLPLVKLLGIGLGFSSGGPVGAVGSRWLWGHSKHYPKDFTFSIFFLWKWDIVWGGGSSKSGLNKEVRFEPPFLLTQMISNDICMQNMLTQSLKSETPAWNLVRIWETSVHDQDLQGGALVDRYLLCNPTNWGLKKVICRWLILAKVGWLTILLGCVVR